MTGDLVSFGRFRLDLGRRKLWRDETPIRLANRALDILSVLVSAKGKVVTKDELVIDLLGWSRSPRCTKPIPGKACHFPIGLR